MELHQPGGSFNLLSPEFMLPLFSRNRPEPFLEAGAYEDGGQ